MTVCNSGTKPDARARGVLEARNLSAVRGNRPVFQGVDLTLAAGEIVALAGCNGAGKTTLLQCLAGILRPAGGEVLWQGEPYRQRPAARKLIGFVGHDSGLYFGLSARENLVFAARMSGVATPEQRAADWLGRVGLEGQPSQPTSALSRGMRQRLAIVRAVIHDPTIVLLDEPFTSLDVDGRNWLAALLCDLRKKSRAIMLTSHDSLFTAGLVDRLVRLRDGDLFETQSDPRNRVAA